MNSSKQATLKFILFDIISTPKALTMALNVQKIKEVVEYEGLSTVPDSCHNIIGIYDLRGTPVPVFDIIGIVSNNKLGQKQESTRIIICDLQNVLIGFPVCKTGRTVTCSASNFLAPPKGGLVNGKKLISGLIKRDEGYTSVLDLDSVLEMIEPETEQEPNLAKEMVSSFNGKKVLIVEDSRIILKKLIRVFSDLGFNVDTAENGADGLAKMKNESIYDLIFTDIEMPLMDGISMVRRMKDEGLQPQAKVLFNSALSNPALIHDIESEKLGRYIVKYDRDLILAEVSIAVKQAA